jgi:hypothetical protein
MISDLKKLVLVPVAMILFLCAASTSPGLTWRANPAGQTLVAAELPKPAPALH